MFVLSLWFSYSLIRAALDVDKIKREEGIQRDSMLEDNLIVWRNFPLGVILTFPDFISYIKQVFQTRDLSSLNP